MVALFTIAFPFGAHAQSFAGPASVIDGDSLRVGTTEVRLHGIDAPEYRQSCIRGGAWACGEEAARTLHRLVQGKEVVCQARDRDVYGRTVAQCTVDGEDVAELMVTYGYAVALPDGAEAYIAREARTRRLRIGIWGSQFEMPAAWRAAHPGTEQPSTAPVQTLRSFSPRPQFMPRATRPSTSGWSYPNCAAARAAGAAPVRAGQPGYGSHLDRDGDGIGCEPYGKR